MSNELDTKLILLKDILNILINDSYLKGSEVIPLNKKPNEHCGCCYCNDCWYLYDECICSHNELLTALLNIPGAS